MLLCFCERYGTLLLDLVVADATVFVRQRRSQGICSEPTLNSEMRSGAILKKNHC